MKKKYIASLIFGWLSTIASAQDIDVLLDTVKVNSHPFGSSMEVTSDGTKKFNIKAFETMPHLLGSADPIRYTQLLPEVQTNTEGDAGIHINGCDNAHNAVMLDGIPVYNPTHLFGLFSVFNASHFREMRLQSSPLLANSENRLGGTLNLMGFGNLFEDDKMKLSGELSAGLLSSQGTLKIPLGRKSRIIVSSRLSYINMLYGSWLKVDNNDLKYHLDDYNLTWQITPTATDRIWLDFYTGSDHVTMQGAINESIALKWNNVLGGLHWNKILSESSWMENMVFYTRYKNCLNADYANYQLDMPSSVSSIGYKGKLLTAQWIVGINYAHHSFSPQQPTVASAQGAYSNKKNHQESDECSAAVDYRYKFRHLPLSLKCGVSGDYYAVNRGEDVFWAVNPSVNIEYENKRNGIWLLHCGVKHQYLQQTGFSALGLPTEFWMSANSENRPQHAQHVLLAYTERLGRYKNVFVKAEIYYTRLYNQIEYTGNLYDFFMTEDYSWEKTLRKAWGYNYGLNLMVKKNSGKLTGWVSYAFSRSRRQADGTDTWFPSNHERPHELNVLASWHKSEKWTFGCTAVLASGTPFTAPKYFYAINDRVLSEYAGYNENRLPAYCRVDLSASYNINSKSSKIRQSLNFSLYNAFANSNTMYYRFKLYKGDYGYRPLCFIKWPLPSVSYYVKF